MAPIICSVMAVPSSLVLETARLLLRPYRRRDVMSIHDAVLASLPDLVPWLPWATGYNRASAVHFVRESQSAWQEGRAYDFTIRRLDHRGSDDGMGPADPGRHLGGISIWYTSRANMVGEIGYWVRSDLTGRGVCTEAAGRVLRYGFDELDLHRIALRIAVGNRASERVAEKLGFLLEGTLRDEVKVGSTWLDHTVWGMLEGEWRRRGRR